MSSSARIDELRRKFDENPRRYFAPLANEYRKAGDFDQAIFICQEYLPQQPGHMSGHIVFGQALFEAKRLPEARTVFETALSLDPENLIALRHLADISRDLGETTAARTWYERVLQADPRNEEIGAIMASLAAAEAAAQAPGPPESESTATTGEVPVTTLPDPMEAPAPSRPASAASAPTVELTAEAVQEMMRARQATRTPPEHDKLTLDDASTVELTFIKETPPLESIESASEKFSLTAPTGSAMGLEGNAAPGEAAPPNATSTPLDGLDTISLDGLDMGSMSQPAAATPPPAPPPPSTSDDGLLDLGSFSFGSPSPAKKSAEIPSATETPIDGGHESADGLMDFSLPPAPSGSPGAAESRDSKPGGLLDAIKSTIPAVADAMESVVPEVLDAVQTSVPAVVEAVMTVPTLVMESIRPEPPQVPEPPRESETPERQTPAFVTETMAQLYLSQGHRSEALEIYRKLIAARPNDAELRARFEAIEQKGRAPSTEPVVAAPAPRPEPARRFTATGPSIRSVLRDLFAVESGSAPGRSNGSSVPADAGSIDILFSTDSVADALSPLAVAFDGGYVAPTGSIDELFAGG